MKKLTLSTIAIFGACALCCLPLIAPVLAGGAVLGMNLFGKPLTLDAIVCGAAPAIIAGLAVFWVVKAIISARTKKSCSTSTCEASGKCGCK